MTAFLKDLRHAVRVLAGTKSWTAVVLLSLALGIGANTALFTAVNGLLLQTIDVPHPGDLVRIKWAGQNDMVRSSSDYGFSDLFGGQRVRATVSYAIYQQFRAANQTMVDLTAFSPNQSLNVVVDGHADLAPSLEATGSFFRTLEVNAALGRTFTDADDSVAASPVAVISDALWRKRFGADPHAINRVVTMNNQQVTIIGVLPASFTSITQLGSTSPDVFVPLAFDSAFSQGQTRMNEPTYWWLLTIGRLKPGVTIDQVRGNLEGPFKAAARAGLDAFTASLTAEQKQLSYNRSRGSAIPTLVVSSAARGSYDLDTNTAQSAAMLSGVVAIVLLIVCANVANLLLSRATSRQREISIRLSMGATRARLVRQLLTESVLLSCLGGLLGVVVGYWSRALLPFGQNAAIDWRVVGFVAGLSLLTGVAFGLAPALRATRVDLAGSMKESGRSVTATRSWLSRGLLVVQVALSLLLARRCRSLPAHARQSPARGRRLQPHEPADVPRESPGQPLRRRAHGLVLRRLADASLGCSRHPVGGVDADDAPRRQHEQQFDVGAGRQRQQGDGREHVRDDRLAVVLRDDGDSGHRGARGDGPGHVDLTESRRHQPGRGARTFPARERDRTPLRQLTRTERPVRDRRRRSRHEVQQHSRCRAADGVLLLSPGADSAAWRSWPEPRRIPTRSPNPCGP